MDGGLNKENVAKFVRAGMTVGEFSSPFLKGPQGKFVPGIGDITQAVQTIRLALDQASESYRTEQGLILGEG